MNIKVWSNFSKRRNSTKQPTGGTQISCVLKETTSIEKPTFVFASNDFTINYVEAFGHYYFVDDIKSVRNNIIEVSCSQDVLATYKTAITGSSQYVERANISGYIPRVPDPLNPPTNDIEIKTTDIINLGWAGNATYILGVVNAEGVCYYSGSQSDINSVLNKVFDSSFIAQFTSQFYGLRESIVSLKKVPYVPAGTLLPVWIGDKPVRDGQGNQISLNRVSQAIIGDSATVMLNRPSDDHEPGTSYIDASPYSIGAVYLPYVGVVPLDMDIIGDTRYLTVEYWLDQVTADVAYKLSTNGKVIGTYSGNCGANQPIAAQNYNAIGVTAGALSAIGGIFTGSAALFAGGVLGSVKECSLHSQINGALASFIGNSVGTMVQACVITRAPIDWDLDVNKTRCGLPIYKQRALSGISGYCKCREASVNVTGFEGDKEAIHGFMNGGFYIE